jgi:hypothetical protein
LTFAPVIWPAHVVSVVPAYSVRLDAATGGCRSFTCQRQQSPVPAARLHQGMNLTTIVPTFRLSRPRGSTARVSRIGSRTGRDNGPTAPRPHAPSNVQGGGQRAATTHGTTVAAGADIAHGVWIAGFVASRRATKANDRDGDVRAVHDKTTTNSLL